MKNYKRLIIIPARGGSKIKDKNIKKFNGKPIIYYSIDSAKKSKLLYHSRFNGKHKIKDL